MESGGFFSARAMSLVESPAFHLSHSSFLRASDNPGRFSLAQAHTSDPNNIENPTVLHRPGKSPSVEGAAEVALRVEIVGRFHGESFCYHPARQATYMAAASRPYT
jgi:hypothetical protein